MDNINSRKSLLPLFVYQILVASSNSFHHLTQSEIIEMLEEYPYGITVDRRALGRILATLAEEDLGIHKSPNGAWHENKEDWHLMGRPGLWKNVA